MDNLKKAVFGLPVAALIGVLASLLSVLFVDGIHWVNAHLQAGAGGMGHTLAVLLLPAGAGLAVGAIIRLMRGEAFVTLADVIMSAQTRVERFATVRAHLLSALAAFVSLAGGASVGQYGPLVHIGSYLGYLHWRGLRLLNRRLALASGAAAAIAAVFHAPLAGMVFAQEVIVRNYSFRSFFLIAVASLSGHMFATNYLHRLPFLQITQMEGVAPLAALGFVLAGVLCGLFAALFVFLVLRVQALMPHTGIAPHWRPALAGLTVGALALLTVPDILGISKPIMDQAVAADAVHDAGTAALTLAAKLLATVACLGMGFAGSVVSPSLAMGGLLGIVFGTVAGAVPAFDVPVHIWAVVCMFAVACPAMGASLSGVLIVLELTQSYHLALVALLAVIPANLVMISVLGGSYYDCQLAARGRRRRPV